ncbi:MucR family transcriptional regulator [Acidisphaera sp. S103]|uniref:MucR family transcriptional regulator n=1 Tax=Acidisphaera sp. S103 TaxID=1747223 RepID=UPI00131B42FE|nr:MucR family transcriptional regulator [Acidisphaera sp. S103]
MTDQNRHLLALSAQIVSAHTGHNEVGIEVLTTVIRNVYNTLADLDVPRSQGVVAVRHTHADESPTNHDHAEHTHSHAHNVYVHPVYGQTVFGDHLICMEDGLTMKMLKRHLLTVHGLTPDEYREKWGLPTDYPMVAADYAKLRSSLALQSGLGLKPEDRPTKKRKNQRG